MKQRTVYALWAVLFIVCAGLGFIPEPAKNLQILLTVFSALFFVPPALLLHLSAKTRDDHTPKLIRNLSALSLVLTMILLILNFLTVLRSAFLGQVLHYVLVIVSCPMICSGHWAMSMFLWACLLMVSLKQSGR